MSSLILNFMSPTRDEFEYEHLDSLQELLENKGTVEWSVSKGTKAGEKVFFFCGSDSEHRLGRLIQEFERDGEKELAELAKRLRPAYKNYHGKILAVGTILTDAKYVESYASYQSNISNIIILDCPVEYILFKNIRRLNSFGAVTYLSDESCQKILQIVVNRNPAQFRENELRPQSIEEQEKETDDLTDSQLKNLATARSAEGICKNRKRTSYQRDPVISAYVKRRADGRCDLCGEPAPFIDSYGKPYLESHHVVWLSKGGRDSIDNTVALCPNCHRKMHMLGNAEDVARLNEKMKTYE